MDAAGSEGSPSRLSQFKHFSPSPILGSDCPSYISESEPEPSPMNEEIVDETLECSFNCSNSSFSFATLHADTALELPNDPMQELSFASSGKSEIRLDGSTPSPENDITCISGYFSHPVAQESPKKSEIKEISASKTMVNTYYETPIDQTEFLRIDQRLKCLSSVEEVAKLVQNPDESQTFHDLFEYLRWTMAEAGVLSQRRVLAIGNKEEELNLTVNVEENESIEDVDEDQAMEENDESFSESYRITQNVSVDVLLPQLIPPIERKSPSPTPEAMNTEEKPSSPLSEPISDQESDLITEKIEKQVLKLMESLLNRDPVSISVRSRHSWDNCVLTPSNTIALKSPNDAEYKQINFNHKGSKKYFTVFIYLLSQIYNLLITNSTSTKRELYYRDPKLTESQRTTDAVLNDISCLLNEPLWKLGVLSSSKGLIAGDLVIIMNNGTFVDGRQERGVIVPADIAAIKEVQSEAKFILIVEKDTVFKKLLDDDIFGKNGGKMILVTGKGYPDINTRHLVKHLIDILTIPAYILVDADPHGIEIMFTYRFGSLAMAHLEQLAAPKITWIGIRPSDIAEFNIPSIPLTYEDIKKLDDMLERPYITEELRAQLIQMRKDKKKAEIESLSSFSSTYLVDQYLPSVIGMNYRRKNC